MKKEEKEKIKAQLAYEPNDKQTAVINRVYNRFRKMKDERDKRRKEFDGRTLTEYVNDNVNASNGIVPDEIKETKEAWQSLIFDQKTRGKVKALVALVVAGRPYISLTGETRADHKYAEDMRLVYEDSHRKEKGQFKLLQQAWDACVKGTIVVEEGYEEIHKEVKIVTGINHETGQLKFKRESIIEGGAGSVICRLTNLLNFYPNENHAEIKDDCILMSYPSQENFDKVYGKYPMAKYVKPGIVYDDIDGIDYKQVGDDRTDIIEVMKYYNENTDEFTILANGVWLNPQDDDEVCPLPYNHKRLPFCKTLFEFADVNCFYGKSLPDIMAGEQETINALLRLSIDQEVLSINKPILLGQGAEIESYVLFPGKTHRIDGDIEQVRELDISGAQGSTFQMLEWLDKKSDVNTAVDSNAVGVHSGRKTAKEAMLLDENSKKLAGMFQKFIYKLLQERAELRIENIAQFYKDPIQYSVLKDSYGKDILDEKGKPVKTPKYREVVISSPGKEPFWIKLKPAVCNAKFIVRMEEDIEPTMSRQERFSIAQAVLDESKANPLISADEATLDWLLSIGKNPDKLYIKPTQNDMRASINGQLPPEAGQGGEANMLDKAMAQQAPATAQQQ